MTRFKAAKILRFRLHAAVSSSLHAHLPRLELESYRGLAVVHWTLAMRGRETGWLTESFHLRCREVLLHALVRYDLLCPAYCLMPDHAHLLWMGTTERADQRKAMKFFRAETLEGLSPFEWQRQPFDHVLRENERKCGAFAAVCQYVLENPVRKGLADRWQDYAFSGAVVPGYPSLDPRDPDYWELFWRIYTAKVG